MKESKEGPRSGKEGRGIKRVFYERDENLRDRADKRRRLDPSPLFEPEEPTFSPAQLIELKRKWHAVLEFRELRADRLCTNELTDAIGEKYGVGSGRNVRILSEKVEQRGSLIRKAGSGAPKTVSNRLENQEFF